MSEVLCLNARVVGPRPFLSGRRAAAEPPSSMADGNDVDEAWIVSRCIADGDAADEAPSALASARPGVASIKWKAS